MDSVVTTHYLHKTLESSHIDTISSKLQYSISELYIVIFSATGFKSHAFDAYRLQLTSTLTHSRRLAYGLHKYDKSADIQHHFHTTLPYTTIEHRRLRQSKKPL